MSTKLTLLKSALQWAFGKDGVNLSVYIVLYGLIYYWDTFAAIIPEPLLFAFVGIIVNLDNNALKAIANNFAKKYEDAKKLIFYMKNGKSFNESVEILSEAEQGTIITKMAPNTSNE